MEREFWSDKSLWPREFDGYVFLGRAADEIGRHLFPEKWTGNEPATKPVALMKPMLSNSFGERLRAYNLLKTHRPDIELEPLPQQVGRLQMPNISISQTQWDAARVICENLRHETVDATNRFAEVQEEIVTRCCSGVLVCAFRARDGGILHPMPREWWNTERNYNRFTRCQVNPRDPFSIGFAGDNFCWIFLTRDSLDRYLTKQPPPPNAADLKHVSPYLRLMLTILRDLDIRPDNQPKKSQVEAALRAKWPEGVAYSQKLEQAMATLLREPESQLGKAKAKAGQRRMGITHRAT